MADVCGWMLEHKLISHMKARNYQAIWDVCGQWTWLLNKVWCNGLFSMSSSAILTIMFQLFMVLLSECFLAFQDYWQINDIRNWVDWLAFKGGF